MPGSPPAAVAWLKVTLLVLLAWNTATYLYAGTQGESLDSIAWFVLLISYELETGPGTRWNRGIASTLVRGSRLAAVAALGMAILSYARDSEWLDVFNIGLWIAVVALLELEVRRPDFVARHRRFVTTTAVALYAGLVALVGVWLWRSEWFDAYDASLWLAAFALLEMDVLGIMNRETPG